MKTFRIRFGERLRYLRLNANLTQEQLASAANISVDFLSLVERGINAPSFETLEKLSNVLVIPVSGFFTFDEQNL